MRIHEYHLRLNAWPRGVWYNAGVGTACCRSEDNGPLFILFSRGEGGIFFLCVALFKAQWSFELDAEISTLWPHSWPSQLTAMDEYDSVVARFTASFTNC